MAVTMYPLTPAGHEAARQASMASGRIDPRVYQVTTLLQGIGYAGKAPYDSTGRDHEWLGQTGSRIFASLWSILGAIEKLNP